MLNIIMIPPPMASSTGLAGAGLDLGAEVLPDPVGPLALLYGLGEAPAGVEEGAQDGVTHLHIAPEMDIVKIDSDFSSTSWYSDFSSTSWYSEVLYTPHQGTVYTGPKYCTVYTPYQGTVHIAPRHCT